MKRTFAVLALLTLSTGTFADTKVEITPEYATKCFNRRFYEVVNSVTKLEKSENTEVVEVSFNTRLFKCSKEGLVPREIEAYKTLVMFNEGVNLPWAYAPDAKIISVSPFESHVTIEFKKSVIFKKSHNRKFSYHLKTNNPRDLYYFWNISLKYEKETDTTTVQLTQ